MKIAFTYNVKLSTLEEEAEYDTQETILAISTALKNGGHQVELLDVNGPPTQIIAQLEALNPDLIFNTAEGSNERFREAFYPALFEKLSIPFTGSDAFVCALTLDKYLTKLFVKERGVPTPASLFILTLQDAKKMDLNFPVILKPNYEGSSKGITQKSVVENKAQFIERLQSNLKMYPQGILVEEYIEGKDITVPFLEGANPSSQGVLSPTEYVFDPLISESRKYQIYDYDLKNNFADSVSVKTPADLNLETKNKIMQYAKIVFSSLGIRDLGRADFRVTSDNKIYFIEVNALPSLEPGCSLYSAAQDCGLQTIEEVFQVIIQNAKKRCLIKPKKTLRPRSFRKLLVGFTYNEKRIIPDWDPNTDGEAEYDSPKTLNAIREAIASYGHEVIDLEATPDLPSLLTKTDVDIVFNIAEGIRGRNREAQIPAILELLNIPYTGSDPATLSITLDKGIAKRIIRESQIETPDFFLMTTGKEKIPAHMSFPMIVKPVAEGSSKGVIRKSVVQNEIELRDIALQLIKHYRQAALVEEFLTGREFTVALLGEKKPRVLPPMEILFMKKESCPVYTYQHKLSGNDEISYHAPAQVDPSLRRELENTAKRAFISLGCRDVARIDLRLDSQERVHFIECNPLPGLTPGWSDLCLISESTGMTYRALIGEIMAPAIRRWKEKNRILLEEKPRLEKIDFSL